MKLISIILFAAPCPCSFMEIDRLLDPEVGFDGGVPGLEVTAMDDCDATGFKELSVAP